MHALVLFLQEVPTETKANTTTVENQSSSHQTKYYIVGTVSILTGQSIERLVVLGVSVATGGRWEINVAAIAVHCTGFDVM